jgi:hypothetical protein
MEPSLVLGVGSNRNLAVQIQTPNELLTEVGDTNCWIDVIAGLVQAAGYCGLIHKTSFKSWSNSASSAVSVSGESLMWSGLVVYDRESDISIYRVTIC